MNAQARVMQAIEQFPFDNFGMDDVSIAIEEDRTGQEWIACLATEICRVLAASEPVSSE